MDSASRDAFLRLVLPAVLVVAVYALWISRQSELTAVEAALAGAKASAVTPEKLFPLHHEIATLNAEQQKLTQEREGLDARWTRMVGLPETTAAKRAAALRQLTRMLWDRGLYPFEESPGELNAPLPASFGDVVRKLTPNARSAGQPRLWKVSFYGRYADVTEALSSLGDLDVALVPLGLTMSEANFDTDWRMWTLVLWI
jgi:hypothetical protein